MVSPSEKGALIQWLMTRYIIVQYVESMKVLCYSKDHVFEEHVELGATRMAGQARDEKDFPQITELVTNALNPFSLRPRHSTK